MADYKCYGTLPVCILDKDVSTKQFQDIVFSR